MRNVVSASLRMNSDYRRWAMTRLKLSVAPRQRCTPGNKRAFPHPGRLGNPHPEQILAKIFKRWEDQSVFMG